MSISKELFLSLDSYNRGYGAGLADENENDSDGLGVSSSNKTYRIGNAVVGSDELLPTGAQDLNFYAIAYDV